MWCLTFTETITEAYYYIRDREKEVGGEGGMEVGERDRMVFCDK